jgi:acyl dehydratase
MRRPTAKGDRAMPSMPVERGKIREYAVATANGRPEYLDDPHPPVPPTFLATVVFWDTISETFEDPAAVAALADAGIGRGVERLLSVEQEYVFHGPLPRAGDVLELTRRFDGVETKQGRRGGRMVFVRFAVEFRGADGLLRAECRYTSAQLAAAAHAVPVASGPRASRSEAPAAAGLPRRRFGPITMTDIVRYQGASGDMNPMHHDDELARSAGYPAAFSVGMLSAGYLAAACTDVYGTESVRRFRTRFRDLVWRGDSLTAIGSVRGHRDEEGEHRVLLDLALTTDAGGVAVEADAEFAVAP